MNLLRLAAFVSVVSTLAACAASDRSYVHFDRGVRRPRTVSIVGVFRDGALDPGAWDTVGPPLAARLGGDACAPLFRSAPLPDRTDVAKRIDAYVRAHGVPDELLDGFASLADGEAIVLVSVATPHFDVPAAGSSTQAGGPGGGRSGPPGGGMGGPPGGGMSGPPGGGMGGPPGGGGGPGGPPPTTAAPPPPPFEISATIFSLATHSVTGTVAISATAEEHVFSLFANRLATELDGARCRRWAKTNLELLPTEAMPP